VETLTPAFERRTNAHLALRTALWLRLSPPINRASTRLIGNVERIFTPR